MGKYTLASIPYFFLFHLLVTSQLIPYVVRQILGGGQLGRQLPSILPCLSTTLAGDLPLIRRWRSRFTSCIARSYHLFAILLPSLFPFHPGNLSIRVRPVPNFPDIPLQSRAQ